MPQTLSADGSGCRHCNRTARAALHPAQYRRFPALVTYKSRTILLTEQTGSRYLQCQFPSDTGEQGASALQ
ncbi:hypothetical protein GCM10010946_14280 [Undibacterium squillarum]|uniref:Uncharacterized protein n=1 Tax=Undibacterium squillarum TaxID=1131567 RepID=A0ABQ2XWA7_9BURK|nr:hypothetical protein GCM10010946_14280 [Undibacterium squillarum]